ncbi:MAG: hypothetical protein E7231_16615 [Cellulosilyticum sp.]|jgi:hypothetical protein|nr:hypothetical protein [Cellulosilyticum sp.]
MHKALDFTKDIENWAKEVSKLPGARKVLNNYQRGQITLNDAYQLLCNVEMLANMAASKEEKKLSWKDLKVDDHFLWVVDEFDGYSEDECIVTDVFDDHLLAHNVKLDIKDIWIDNDAEIKKVEGK